MVCRHDKNDPNCSSHPNYRPSVYVPPYSQTPDSRNFQIVEAFEHPGGLVLQVKYPNCAKCAFEGTKTIVYQNVRCIDALKWKEIDPHFTGTSQKNPQSAPSPVARFPGNAQGLALAKLFMDLLVQQTK